jgi:hypothetical protein
MLENSVALGQQMHKALVACWRVLMFHNFLHHAQRNALKGIHQTLRMSMQ